MTRPELNKCQCSFRIRVVGDGCQYCNPEFWKEKLREQAEDETREWANDTKLERLEK